MMFHVGQKVVCIDDDTSTPTGFICLSYVEHPKKGAVYTVRDLRIAQVTGVPCLLVEEIPDQDVDIVYLGGLYTAHILFRCDQFRPVVERKTDISIFKAMLNNSKVGQPA